MLRKKTLTKYLSRQRRNELEEEKKLGKSKWKRMTAETKRDKGSKKDEKTALTKGRRDQEIRPGNPAWEGGADFESPETKESEEAGKSH